MSRGKDERDNVVSWVSGKSRSIALAGPLRITGGGDRSPSSVKWGLREDTPNRAPQDILDTGAVSMNSLGVLKTRRMELPVPTDERTMIKDLDTMLERLRENEEISRKFHEIEVRILSILNFTDLFESLLSEFKEKFNVPYVWLSLIEPSEVSSLIQSLAASEILRERMNIVDKDEFMTVVGRGMHPILANQNMARFRRLLPRDETYPVGSIAVAPISLDGEIIGSLNQADPSSRRFIPGIDASLLERLSVKFSLCLSNVTAHEKLRFLAYHDPLTGLLNRRVLGEIMKRELVRARRYKSPLSLVFLDLDDFKSVNDRYGHDSGDRVLKLVADRLVRTCRNSDVVARFAGDEFVVLLPETTRRNAEGRIERMRSDLLEHPFMVEGSPVTVQITFGAASTEEGAVDTADMLLKTADERQYRAKHRKKGR